MVNAGVLVEMNSFTRTRLLARSVSASLLRRFGVTVDVPIGRIAQTKGSMRDSICRALWTTGRWQPPIEDLLELSFHNSPEGVFLDVGANVGHFSVLATHFGASHVIAIEALPELCTKIESIASELSLPIKTVSAMVGPPHMRASILRGPDSNIGGTQVRETDSSTSESSKTVTLSSLVQKSVRHDIAFIKIDIEGLELFALESIAEWIQNQETHLPPIVFEWTPKFATNLSLDYSQVFSAFLQYGYQSYSLPPASYDGGNPMGKSWQGLLRVNVLPNFRSDILLAHPQRSEVLLEFLEDLLA